RAIHFGNAGNVASADRLAAWIGVQRDADGGYGSPLATRMVVRALLAEGPALKETSRVKIASGNFKREIDVAPSAHLVLSLPANATKVNVEVKGPGVIARFERPVLRLWSSPPDENKSPLHIEAIWPKDLKAGTSATLLLRVRNGFGTSETIDTTLPLP